MELGKILRLYGTIYTPVVRAPVPGQPNTIYLHIRSSVQFTSIAGLFTIIEACRTEYVAAALVLAGDTSSSVVGSTLGTLPHPPQCRLTDIPRLRRLTQPQT